MEVDDKVVNLFDLAEKANEPLEVALQGYVEEGGVFGRSLTHPLVYMIPLINNGLANLVYRDKVRAVEEAEANKDWARYIWLHERPYRFDAFTTISGYLDDIEYWQWARSVWIDSENIFQHLEDWIEVFHGRDIKNRLLMMDNDEREKYELWLPDTIKVWRGCVLGLNEDGLSWTLDRKVADWFARRFTHLGDGVVIEGEVKKADVAAYLSGRGESEIVVPSLEAVRVIKYYE